MFTKRTLLALFSFAVLTPLAGCRHNKCCSNYSPPPACCPAPPPGAFLPPPGP